MAAIVEALSMTKLLLENDRVKVFEFSLKPGEKGVLEHPYPYVVYSLDSGSASLTYQDGRIQKIETKSGMTMFQPAGRVSIENTGKSENRVLIVEVK